MLFDHGHLNTGLIVYLHVIPRVHGCTVPAVARVYACELMCMNRAAWSVMKYPMCCSPVWQTLTWTRSPAVSLDLPPRHCRQPTERALSTTAEHPRWAA